MPLLKHLLEIIKNYFPWVLLAISIIINVYLFNLEKVVYKDNYVKLYIHAKNKDYTILFDKEDIEYFLNHRINDCIHC